MSEWELRYSDHVRDHDIPKLDRTVRTRIRSTIDKKLKHEPMHFGKPLRYSLNGQRSLRIGDYRVLYLIDHTKQCVLITAIGHRSDIYD